MLKKRYNNFVRPSSPEEIKPCSSVSGEDARRLYLEEINKAGTTMTHNRLARPNIKTKQMAKKIKLENISKKDLFLGAQNNDVYTLKQILDTCPNMLNMTDEYGWSLLMIACQANSVDAVEMLLQRGINTSVRDKAGNSAQSLVIKSRNITLADILLRYRSNEPLTTQKTPEEITCKPEISKGISYFCEICNKEFPDKEDHLSSTVHNIDASKGKKIPSSYVIPSSNKGYQIMLKVGWDKEFGLGPDGTGKKYPIKTVQKKDRKGLGLDKRKKSEERKETSKHTNRNLLERECKNHKSMEISFRRQFY